jgi:sirohydrochlorin ferrochelatase
MRGILILAHGSRETATEQTLQQVIGHLQEIFSDEIIETAYLQFSKTDLETGLDRLKANGADDIVVIPYFLFEGVHIKEDIPKEIETYREAHPCIKVALGKTLGADPRLAEILADRIRQAL